MKIICLFICSLLTINAYGMQSSTAQSNVAKEGEGTLASLSSIAIVSDDRQSTVQILEKIAEEEEDEKLLLPMVGMNVTIDTFLTENDEKNSKVSNLSSMASEVSMTPEETMRKLLIEEELDDEDDQLTEADTTNDTVKINEKWCIAKKEVLCDGDWEFGSHGCIVIQANARLVLRNVNLAGISQDNLIFADKSSELLLDGSSLYFSKTYKFEQGTIWIKNKCSFHVDWTWQHWFLCCFYSTPMMIWGHDALIKIKCKGALSLHDLEVFKNASKVPISHKFQTTDFSGKQLDSKKKI